MKENLPAETKKGTDTVSYEIPRGEFTNNFFTFLPGGFAYRQKGWKDIDPTLADVINAVDRLLAENPVNVEEIQDKMQRVNKNPGSEEALRLLWEVHQVLYPLFKKMLDQGFSKKDIW